ncbi:MAG: aminopeptidase N [Mariprofundaceae bacterium]
MSDSNTVYLKDYQAPSFEVLQLELLFCLNPNDTLVTSTAKYQRQDSPISHQDLYLDGHGLELRSLRLDGMALEPSQYLCDDKGLTVLSVPDTFELEIVTIINPESNTALEGLYRSGGNYCTQCEAQGFRSITYYQDRPDVMTEFKVRIEADKQTNPVLLSNGNLIGQGDLEQGRHWVQWHDPFAKPCYLFALVAGDLQCVEDHYQTQSGRMVSLKIFTELHHIEHCAHAMASLKRAMAWDEQCFGLEYDLDLFMIVAVDDFNMGAMENKGLNIFNSRLVFATPQTATDADYIAIEAVIGHEYFHNWTGNRVTCRDWFQLSLKEGLTVFRDQKFTADLHSQAVKRIEDVRLLRTHQFAEDASPMAHPIRPSSYMEINNFYTVTVYEKGAEVVRIYHTLLGEQGFRRGMDLYFKRHDGQAVSTEDFLAAMSDANSVDLTAMQYWYEQAGTPHLQVDMEYDAERKECTLHCVQSCPPTPESENKHAFLIPLSLSLLSPKGQPIALQLQGEVEPNGCERTLALQEFSQSFTFINVHEKPLPSLLRGFSAPVQLEYAYSLDDLALLMKFDDDSFNRWAACQQLSMQVLLALLQSEQDHSAVLILAMQHLFDDKAMDLGLKSEAFSLPSESDIAEAVGVSINPIAIHKVRESLRLMIASQLQSEFEHCYHQLADGSQAGLSDELMQKRRFKNICLDYLLVLGDEIWIEKAYQQCLRAENMTDQYAALASLAHCDVPQRQLALQAFENQWQHDSQVMDKWFAVQAGSHLSGVLGEVKTLLEHPLFDMHNPNKVRALLGTLAMRNPVGFHHESGDTYRFVADQIMLLDQLNPQIASRMVRAFMSWKKLETGRSQLLHTSLLAIASQQGLSGDVHEIVSKSLL